MGFSEEKKESFNKFFKEVSRNGFKNINKRDEKGETVLHHAVKFRSQNSEVINRKRSGDQCKR